MSQFTLRKVLNNICHIGGTVEDRSNASFISLRNKRAYPLTFANVIDAQSSKATYGFIDLRNITL
jgi:hypothetical protein